MPIPNFQGLFAPILTAHLDGLEHSTVQIREEVSTALGLTPNELEEKLPSGAQSLFINRAAWSIVYLTKAGMLQNVRRGVYQITERGRSIIRAHPDSIDTQMLSDFPEFIAFVKGNASADGKPEADFKSAQTPMEQLTNAREILRSTLAAEILEAVGKASPSFFEKLVVKLLLAMGYGGSLEEAGKAVGKGGDGGIDGIIKQDKLGLEVIYIQAKRWTNSVGRPLVQAFAGSLEGVKARKGVFITTSTFTADAQEYVSKIEKKIVLINGRRLAELMIDHNVGVGETQTFEVKKLDSDYFEEVT
jgi:restriction system protein